MPPLHTPDWQTLPHDPQFDGSDWRFAQTVRPPDLHTRLRGQQNGLTPGGGTRRPGLLSAIWPAGQQSFGLLFRRSAGQQIAGVRGRMPTLPGRIGIAHFVRGGQQTCRGPFTQHERLFGQQPASPQQREVRRSQHLFPHSSSLERQRLQSPLRSLTHCHLGGQHLSRPHHARPRGQRFVQTPELPVPTRKVLHSSFGAQHCRPLHGRSPCLQQSFSRGFAQYSSAPQQENGEPQVLMHMQFDSPAAGFPQRVPGGHAAAPVGSPSAFL